ncbi:MAG: FAD/NAD(P)-binding oxidoreductase [Burkholderiaceae bacterium]
MFKNAPISTQASAANHVTHDIVIVGGGAAGIAVASSLKARQPKLDIVIIEPADVNYYQPGWTMVGGGVFTAEQTVRKMSSVIPSGVQWIQARVTALDPDSKTVVLEGDKTVTYSSLIVAAGLKINWDGIEGLTDALGGNGVTSNYRFDLAPYTWDLVRKLKKGRAVFTQAPMPIKCPGAPQKAMYLSADHWLKTGCLKDIEVGFYTAGAVLFGIKEYVPALMEYVKRYEATLNFQHTLVKVEGAAKRATFKRVDAEGAISMVETEFDMLHVTPPQGAPDFVKNSKLADAAGFMDIDSKTLRHKTYAGVYALGDVGNTPNSKTAAAARKQAPVVAHNVCNDLFSSKQADAIYDGYGSCPLTVERGKVVLAEFGYDGKLMHSFPNWLIDGTQPSQLAWILKERILPPVYWDLMLKGKEWMAKPAFEI